VQKPRETVEWRPTGSPRAQLTRGYAAALAAAAFLSTTAIFIRHLTQTYALPPLVLAFWRDVFVVVTLLPVLGIGFPALLRVGKNDLRYLLGYGLSLALFNALWTLSVALNGAAVATVLVYCSAGFTVLLGWWLLKERLTWARLAAAGLSLAGCALVAGLFESGSLRLNAGGALAGILAGLLYAVYSLMGRQAAHRGLNPWTTLLYTFGFAGAFLLLANLLPGGPLPGSAQSGADFFTLGTALAGWAVLVLLAAVPTVGGFGLYNVSLSLLPSSVANLILTLEPVFTALTAYLLLNEQMTLMQALGSVVTLGGVVFLRLWEGRSGTA